MITKSYETLTIPRVFRDALKPEGAHLLRLGGYQATFLPQVWEQLPSFDLFFSHLCQKAGLGSNCLYEHPEIQHYQVQKIT